MADVFRDRGKAYEAKYKQDEELRFKAESRRNRLLGEWLADAFGLTGDARKSYAMEVVQSDFDAPGVEDLIRKVMKDIKTRGAKLTEQDVRKEMDRLYGIALEQIRNDFPKALGPDRGKVGD